MSRFMKRCDDEQELLNAIEHYEKQPQNRQTRRRLAKLREQFDKLCPPIPGEDSEAAIDPALPVKP